MQVCSDEPKQDLHINIAILLKYCSYMAKHLWEKCFVFRVENGYSMEKFCSSMLITYIANRQSHNSWEKNCN